VGPRSQDAASSLNNLGLVYRRQGRLDDAEKLHREALAIQRELHKERAGDEELELAAATSLNNLALALQLLARQPPGDAARRSEAERSCSEALEIQKRLLPEPDKNPAIAVTLDNLASILADEGNLPDAETFCRRALDMKMKVFGEDSAEVATSQYTLAVIVYKQDRFDEAESLMRDSLVLRRKLLGDGNPDVTAALRSLAGVLKRERKYDEVEKLYADFLTPDFTTRPQSADLLRERADFFARRGRWAEAAADATRASQHQPENEAVFHLLAPLQVQCDDAEGYRRLCGQMLAHFSGTNDPIAAARVATDCMIRPVTGMDWNAANSLIETAMAAGRTNAGVLPYMQFVKGLAEYRAGRFAAAGDLMSQVLSKSGDDASRDAAAQIVLAMSRQQLKQPDAAREAFTKGEDIAATKLPKLESGDLGSGWRDWVIVQSLLKEARPMIEARMAESAK
jgi:tetratricopeptide (TPR) repeat protein